ncbi:unnamed protein product [Meganyctiphanes norvegica]|uniref:Uncharacterized protein n=1 Tax=Meganyctiphanes norvegica TaxID=48144 RepID=A0AAV2RZQ5_MEGNR
MNINISMINKTDCGLETFLDINRNILQKPQAWKEIITSQITVKKEPCSYLQELYGSASQDMHCNISASQSTVKKEPCSYIQELYGSASQDRHCNISASQSTVKSEPFPYIQGFYGSATQERSLVYTVPYIKQDISVNTQDSFLINRSNAQDVATMYVNTDICHKRIKLEMPRAQSPLLFGY